MKQLKKLKLLRVCRYIWYIGFAFLIFWGIFSISIDCINHWFGRPVLKTLNEMPFYYNIYRLTTIILLIDFIIILFVETGGLLPSLKKLNNEIDALEDEECENSAPTKIENNFYDNSQNIDKSKNINISK